MLSYIFYFFLAYLAYQLVFKFILPIYRTTRQVKRGFNEMKERMNGHAPADQTASRVTPKGKPIGDYIDFEEVKQK
jgi:hypothetical protein